MQVLDMAGHLIRRLHQHSTLTFSARTQAEGHDLTPVQFAALDAVFHHPGVDQAFVAEMIGYDRATIGGVIDRMEKKGWISRTVSSQDRRSRVLSLTSRGKHIHHALLPIVLELQKDILGPLSKEEHDTLIRLMRKIVSAGNNTVPRDSVLTSVKRQHQSTP
jgi:DNA-binding MarR family transcriptional regulator